MMQNPSMSQTMDERRIVLLGKTGDGKSSAGNLILGEQVFGSKCSPNSQTQKCYLNTKPINEKLITVIDTPGFFDTSLTSEELNSEILRCVTECAPGPHAFVIVLKVGRYTKHEIETVKKITESFGEDALKYAVVLFTFGDQLPEGQMIEDFVKQSRELQDLVNKCGGRVHVIDNKYWNEQQDEYRSNRVQVEKLLNTIEEMVRENRGECYTNEMLQLVDKVIDAECKASCEEGKEVPDIKIVREQAKPRVHSNLLAKLVGTGTGALTGAFLGLGVLISASVPACTAGILGTSSAAGAIAGVISGNQGADGAETVDEAMKMAYKETVEGAIEVIDKIKELLS
uniref:AIG1-type G domain-containing protein n=2 Tax=Electrophorus electricus TaxID=8005 RepID=A0AAY5EBD0_ELEEL